MKNRAARFGIPVVTDNKRKGQGKGGEAVNKLSKRAERFGKGGKGARSAEMEAKIAARAARFGTSAKAGGKSKEMQEKLAKRAARFEGEAGEKSAPVSGAEKVRRGRTFPAAAPVRKPGTTATTIANNQHRCSVPLRRLSAVMTHACTGLRRCV